MVKRAEKRSLDDGLAGSLGREYPAQLLLLGIFHPELHTICESRLQNSFRGVLTEYN